MISTPLVRHKSICRSLTRERRGCPLPSQARHHKTETTRHATTPQRRILHSIVHRLCIVVSHPIHSHAKPYHGAPSQPHQPLPHTSSVLQQHLLSANHTTSPPPSHISHQQAPQMEMPFISSSIKPHDGSKSCLQCAEPRKSDVTAVPFSYS